MITYFFTLKWVSFGNFSTFHNKNLKTLLSNDSSWYAHSSSVLKNCKVKRLYSKREKRYFDKSKLGIFSLIEHSLRVNTVFYKNICILSIMYSLFFFSYIESSFKYLLIFGFLLFNFLILSIKIKHWIKNFSKTSNYIKKINLIKTS